MSESIKKFYSNLANELVQRLTAAAREFGIESVENHYNNMFNIQFLANSISNLLKTVDTNKTIKDGTYMLTIPITQICNLSI